MTDTDKYVLRFAPSPTGRPHLGNFRTAIYNHLLIARHGGRHIFRIEDTDQNKKIQQGNEILKEFVNEFELNITESEDLGGEHGPYVQSERLDIYKKYAEQLLAEGHAYRCFCTKERLAEMREKQMQDKEKLGYDGHCRNLSDEEVQQNLAKGLPYVIRLKVDKTKSTKIRDEVVGDIVIQNNEVDDQILLKSDGYPTYFLAVVIDDHLMGVTHIIRGQDWISSVPKIVILYEALGWQPPKFVHVPLILAPTGKGKLSKRHGAMPAFLYLRKGYLREAMFNYFAMIGWAPEASVARQDEIYTIEELASVFDISGIQKSGGRYDENKFNHINSQHIRRLDLDILVDRVFFWAREHVLADLVQDSAGLMDWEVALKASVGRYLPMWEADREKFGKALSLIKERIDFLSEIVDKLAYLYDEVIEWEIEDWDMKKHSSAEHADALRELLPALRAVEKGLSHDVWEKTVRDTADRLGWKHGQLFMSLRSAITGTTKSPPLYESMEILGWENSWKRIGEAIDWLSVI